jgi:hypothetical protein
VKLRPWILALIALAAVSLAATAAGGAQPRGVVQPNLRSLGKEPAVAHLRHFLHSLRKREHASRHAYRRLVERKQRFSSAARNVPEVRDGKRKHFLRTYLAKPGRHHRGRTRERSLAYYSFLLSFETHRVRQLVAGISDEIDRLAYS